MENDYIEMIREHQRAAHEAEQALIATKPTLFDADVENFSDSYKWLRFPIPDDASEPEARTILSDIELFPNDCLAGILVEGCKDRISRDVHLDSISIDRIGTRFRFYISGSTTLRELQTLCEQYRARSGREEEV